MVRRANSEYHSSVCQSDRKWFHCQSNPHASIRGPRGRTALVDILESFECSSKRNRISINFANRRCNAHILDAIAHHSSLWPTARKSCVRYSRNRKSPRCPNFGRANNILTAVQRKNVLNEVILNIEIQTFSASLMRPTIQVKSRPYIVRHSENLVLVALAALDSGPLSI